MERGVNLRQGGLDVFVELPQRLVIQGVDVNCDFFVRVYLLQIDLVLSPKQ